MDPYTRPQHPRGAAGMPSARGALLLAAGALLPRPAGAEWSQVLKAAPWSARSDPQLVNLKGTLFLLGGHANSSYYNDVWRSNDTGRTWDLALAAAPWAPRSYHTAKILDDHMYLVAGHDADTWFGDVWRSPDGVTWELVTDKASWKARAACALQVRRGRMLLFGGSDGLLPPIGNGTVFNDVWASDDKGATWMQLTAAAPWPAREGLQKLTALHGPMDEVVLTAGEAGYTGPYYNDVWSTTDGANWTLRRPHAEFSGRSGNLLLSVSDALYTFGGFGNPMKRDGYCLPAGSDAGAAWKSLGDAPWEGRYDYDMIPAAGGIVLLGGEASLYGSGGPYFNDVWSLATPQC